MSADRFHGFNPCGLGRSLLCLVGLVCASSAQTRLQNAARPAQPPTSAPSPQFKAIWEPMNYSDDIELQDVFFANDKVGWIAGKGSGGFILHTSDGGQHWDVQMGDPHSNTAGVSSLRFLDATHGWALQGGQLIRTLDGTTWHVVGPLPGGAGTAGGAYGYQFTTLQDGYAIVGDWNNHEWLYATRDGGRSWKQVYECGTTLQLNGLVRNVGCLLEQLQFPSLKVGYAAGAVASGAVVVKTVDGGTTWRVIFANSDLGSPATSVFFTDENNGVVRLHDGRVLITADGGQNWSGATGLANYVVKFADPEVGWSCVEGSGPSCSITVDSGKNWITHDIKLPEDIESYTVPRRDLVVMVGAHGMIYRYRVVPVGYTAPGIADATMVPAYGGPIVTQIQQMQTQVAALQTQLGGAAASAASAPTANSAPQNASTPSGGGGMIANQAAPASGGFIQNSAAPSAPATGGFSQDSSAPSNAAMPAAPAATGGFSQDASASAAPAGGFTQDTSAAAAGGFTQDVSAAPTSSFVQGCCASQVQSLQTSFGGVAQQVPTFTGKFKDLNLLFVGLNMLNEMMSKTKQMKDELLALKSATTPQAALAALSALSNSLASTSQSIATQFQGLSAGAPPGMSGGGIIGNQAAGANSQPGATTATPGAAQTPGAQTPAAQNGSAPASTTPSSSAGSVLNKLKKKIPSPF